jgi:hypothetical protein
MARIEGVDAKRAGLLVRAVYWLVKRKIGRVVEPVRITAHVPRLLRAYGTMEMAQEKLRSVDASLKALCQIKAAMMIGCPF